MSVLRLIALAVALAVPLAAAAPAAADDASVLAAFRSQDAQLKRLGDRFTSLERAWRRSDYRRSAPLLRNLARTREAVVAVGDAVLAEGPSSEAGSRGKSLALRSLGAFESFTIGAADGVRQLSAGVRRRSVAQMRRGRRLLASAERRLRLAGRYEDQAIAAFREAGLG